MNIPETKLHSLVAIFEAVGAKPSEDLAIASLCFLLQLLECQHFFEYFFNAISQDILLPLSVSQ